VEQARAFESGVWINSARLNRDACGSSPFL
jgi:hypothetical protein